MLRSKKKLLSCLCLFFIIGCGRTNDEIKTRFSQKIQGVSSQWRDIHIADDSEAGPTIKASYYSGNGRYDISADYLRQYSMISARYGEKEKSISFYLDNKSGKPYLMRDGLAMPDEERAMVHSLLKDAVMAMKWAAN